MRLVLFITVLTISTVIINCKNLNTTTPADDDDSDSDETWWEDFKGKFKKKYSDVDEESKRKDIFLKNKDFIKTTNKQLKDANETFFLKLNNKADREKEELQIRAGAVPPKFDTRRTLPNNNRLDRRQTLPLFVNWTAKGYVTPVIDQGYCGSCWAIGAMESLEAQYKKFSSKPIVQLSYQNVMDCATSNACDGAWMSDAFDYVIRNKGLDTAASYPYQGVVNNACRFKNISIGATQTDYAYTNYDDDDDLKHAVATIGPIVAAIYSSDDAFLYYGGGIYTNANCPTDVDHSILVVGYNVTDPNNSYWIVKNSWGTSWGEYGFVKMSMKPNFCGIAMWGMYPVV